MPPFETTLSVLIVPTVAWASGALAILPSVSSLRAKDPIAVPAGAGGRLLAYFAVSAVPILFGLVLWFLAAGLETDFGPSSGTVATLVIWIGVTFAWVAVMATATHAWVVRTRLREFVGLNFPRVLPLLTVPTTLIVFVIVIGVLVMSRISRMLASGALPPELWATRVVLGLQVFGISCVALPLAAARTKRISGLSRPQDFIRALALADVGVLPPIVALAWALFQLA